MFLKKINAMKGKLDIKGFLMINYLITFVILFIVIKLSTKSALYIVQKYIYKNQPITISNINELYNDDFNKIDIGGLEKFGIWIEILDENKKIIFVKGEKKDNIIQYTEKQLYDIISPQESYSVEKPYLGELAMIEGKNGSQYILLLKGDKRRFSKDTVYKPNFTEKEDILQVLYTDGIYYLLLCLFLIIGIYIYSLISSKFITKPLRYFIDSIKKLKVLDYEARLDIRGLSEFLEIENEFNNMTQRLQEAEKQKEQIENSKKRLLIDISHDLKTPITSIQGFSKLLLNEKVTLEERIKFLNIIYNKSMYATALIEDLFQLSKLEDTEYKISAIKGDFCEWLKRLIAEYYGEFNNSGFKLEVDISEQPIYLNFDHILMKRALSNILNNSLIYNSVGTTIAISCYLENTFLIFKISDNGKGIEEGIKDKIFDPFVKCEDKNLKGSGLGLAITKKIIEMHGGNISLTNNNEYKTIFKICIPFEVQF